MANKLTIDYQTLYSEVSYFLGLTTRGTAPTGTNLTTCKDIVARGMRRFLYPVNAATGVPHDWQFLRQFHTFNALTDKWKYSLPHDFADMCDTIHYETDELQPPLIRRDADQILEMRSDVVSSEWPQFFAIVPTSFDMEIGTEYEIWLYPNPDQTYKMNFFYRMDPIKLSATTDMAPGGIFAAEALLETCLAVAEQQEDEVVGIHTQLSEELIQKLIRFDTRLSTGKVGNLYDNELREWPPPRQYFVDYNDSNIYAAQRS